MHATVPLTLASVFNHYRRIEPFLPGPNDPPRGPVSTQAPASEDLPWDQPSFEADLDTTSGVRDSTRVVGSEDGQDPTVTHGVLSREERWSESLASL